MKNRLSTSALLLVLLLSGCRQVLPVPAVPGTSAVQPSPVPSIEVGEPQPLPSAPELIFTIANPEPFSGRMGDPKPDWPGWGASGFDVDSDGSFWIADSAAQPPRLLHYTEQGELLDAFSLEGVAVFPVDVAVTAEAVWLVDSSGMPPQLVRLDRQGQVLSTHPLPEEVAMNALNNLIAGENEELWLDGAAGLHQLAKDGEELRFEPSPGFRFAGHTYTTTSGQVRVDAETVQIETLQENVSPAGFELVGAAPDGRFYILSFEMKEVIKISVDRIAQAFSPQGELLGVARLPEPYLYVENDLVVDPSSQLVFMLFQPDHAVEFWRLGFTAALPAVSAIPVRPSVSHAAGLEPLSPAWRVTQPPAGAAELEIARNTLVAFFWHLSQGEYDLAAPLYGGDVRTYADMNPELQPGDYAGLWEFICTGPLQCLPAGRIVS